MRHAARWSSIVPPYPIVAAVWQCGSVAGGRKSAPLLALARVGCVAARVYPVSVRARCGLCAQHTGQHEWQPSSLRTSYAVQMLCSSLRADWLGELAENGAFYIFKVCGDRWRAASLCFPFLSFLPSAFHSEWRSLGERLGLGSGHTAAVGWLWLCAL